jgi:hypothetical protein
MIARIELISPSVKSYPINLMRRSYTQYLSHNFNERRTV